MRPTTCRLAHQLSWLVLASLVPAAWVAAALAASVYEPTGANALVLVMGVMALIAGAAVSILMARGLRRALDDLAAEAELLSRERPLSRLQPAVCELARIADGLAAAGVRLEQALRATAAVERDPSGAAFAIAGMFEDLGDGNPAQSSPSAPADAWSADATSLLQMIAAKMRRRAHAAGIDFGAAIMPDLGPLDGDVGAIATALSGLGENALTFTARGGRILLRANRAADGALRIALGPAGRAASDGLEMAGHMIELDCGALAAKRIEEARTLLAANGGRLAIKRVPGQGDAVTIVLPRAEAQRKAA